MTEKPAAKDAAPVDDIKPAKQQSAGSLAAAYFVARFGLFLVILGIFWAVGFRGLPGALAAAIVSIPVSFLVLGKMRTRVASRMQERKIDQLSLKEEFRTVGHKDDAEPATSAARKTAKNKGATKADATGDVTKSEDAAQSAARKGVSSKAKNTDGDAEA